MLPGNPVIWLYGYIDIGVSIRFVLQRGEKLFGPLSQAVHIDVFAHQLPLQVRPRSWVWLSNVIGHAIVPGEHRLLEGIVLWPVFADNPQDAFW